MPEWSARPGRLSLLQQLVADAGLGVEEAAGVAQLAPKRWA